MTGRTISTGVKHMKTFYAFAFKSISFKDFSFLEAIIGGSLEISLSRGWLCIMCHFPIKACFIFDTEGSYFVTKSQNVFAIFMTLCEFYSREYFSYDVVRVTTGQQAILNFKSSPHT